MVSSCCILLFLRCFDEVFYAPQEVAQILGIHVKTVRKYLRTATVKGQKIGRSGKGSLRSLKIIWTIEHRNRWKMCLKEKRNSLSQTLYHNHESELCRFQYELEDHIAKFMVALDFL